MRGLAGEYLWLADEQQARDLLHSGSVRLIRRRGCARVLQAVVAISRDDQLRLAGRGTAADHMRYSHDHETRENPPRVWTFTKLWAA